MDKNLKHLFYILLGLVLVIGYIGGCASNKYLFNKTDNIQVDSIYTKGIVSYDTITITHTDTIEKVKFIPKYVTVSTTDTLIMDIAKIDSLHNSKIPFTINYKDTITDPNYKIRDELTISNMGTLINRLTEVEIQKDTIVKTQTDTIQLLKTETKYNNGFYLGGQIGNNFNTDIVANLQLKNITLTANKSITNNGFRLGILKKIGKRNKKNTKRTKKNKSRNKKFLSFLFKKRVHEELQE